MFPIRRTQYDFLLRCNLDLSGHGVDIKAIQCHSVFLALLHL